MKQLPKFACLENTLDSSKPSFYFDSPVDEISCITPINIKSALDQLESLQQQGLYLVGYVSYEAAYYLNSDFTSMQDQDASFCTPLIHFVAFKNCQLQSSQKQSTYSVFPAIDMIHDCLSYKQYMKDFAVIQKALLDGESYQINYTKRVQLRSPLSVFELYQQLKAQQPVQYSAFLPFSPVTVLSFSPELFFKKTANLITVKPMKGTSARFDDPVLDQNSYTFLKNDSKNKAENLIIIDLLRNDLARFCETGSIEVIDAFDIETYKSVYQMTSTLSAKLVPETSFSHILKNLFPCGSITGAPKKRTMEFIKNLEPARNLYTGCIGYILPNNDMCFNVAIRTLSQKPNNLFECGVGGGFTIQSTCDDEWQEMLTKLTFLKRCYQPSFNLIETLLYDRKGFTSLDLHLQRLIYSAQCLHFTLNPMDIESDLLNYALQYLKNQNNKTYKVRVEVDYKGGYKISHQTITIPTENTAITIYICPEKIESSHPLWLHKTTDKSTRGFYETMHNKYLNGAEGAELIYINEKGHITEARFYNIIVEINHTLFTPSLSDGLLPGIARSKIINNGVIERSITPDELTTATAIYLINDIRGKIPVTLAQTKLPILLNTHKK